MPTHGDEVRTDPAATSPTEPEVVNRYPGTGVTAILLGLAVLALAAVFLLAQNTEAVPFEFLWIDADVPLYVLFLATAFVASLATVLTSAVWRRRRRRLRAEREELQRLRQRLGS